MPQRLINDASEQLVTLLPLLAFDTDRQAAKRRRVADVGKRSTVRHERSPRSSGLKVFLRLIVERSGMVRRFNGHQSSVSRVLIGYVL